MSTAACCLPTVIPTVRPWYLDAWQRVRVAIGDALAAQRRRLAADACQHALRQLPRHALRDLGLTGCVPHDPRESHAAWAHWELGGWR